MPTNAGRVVFKALTQDGLSPLRKWKWPLPPDENTPGEWVAVEGKPRLCMHGFHGYHDRSTAEREGAVVYEMEVAGETVEDFTKLAATRARLLRRVPVFQPIRVGYGDAPCQECGKVHDYYQLGPDPRGFHSWGDPDDGHPYRRESTSQVIERVLNLVEASTDGTIQVSALLEALGRRHPSVDGSSSHSEPLRPEAAPNPESESRHA